MKSVIILAVPMTGPHAGSSGRYSYSYGYQDPDENFRTVMSYNCPGGCTQIEYFSNPNVTYMGDPTGIAESESQFSR